MSSFYSLSISFFRFSSSFHFAVLFYLVLASLFCLLYHSSFFSILFLETRVDLVQSRLPHGANLFGDPKKSFAFFRHSAGWDASSPVSWKRFSIVAWIHKRLPYRRPTRKPNPPVGNECAAFSFSDEKTSPRSTLVPSEDLLICFTKLPEQLVYPWLG